MDSSMNKPDEQKKNKTIDGTNQRNKSTSKQTIKQSNSISMEKKQSTTSRWKKLNEQHMNQQQINQTTRQGTNQSNTPTKEIKIKWTSQRFVHIFWRVETHTPVASLTISHAIVVALSFLFVAAIAIAIAGNRRRRFARAAERIVRLHKHRPKTVFFWFRDVLGVWTTIQEPFREPFPETFGEGGCNHFRVGPG